MGVVGDHPVTLVTLGDIKNPLVLLGCLALVVMIVLEKMKVKGNIIIGILAFSILAWLPMWDWTGATIEGGSSLAKFNGIFSAPPSMSYLLMLLKVLVQEKSFTGRWFNSYIHTFLYRLF